MTAFPLVHGKHCYFLAGKLNKIFLYEIRIQALFERHVKQTLLLVQDGEWNCLSAIAFGRILGRPWYETHRPYVIIIAPYRIPGSPLCLRICSE